jgi:glycerophosphoryl diester phosphodiesterase
MTLIIAHRGCSGEYIDNSYEALLKALDMNVDMIELDVRLCGSETLVIHHDWRIGKDLIHQSTSTYLKNKYHIMTLDDVLQIYELYITKNNNIQLLLDIKTPHYADENKDKQEIKLVKTLNKYSQNNKLLYQNIICSSFNVEILENIYKYNPNIKLGYITDYIDDNIKYLPNIPIYSISIYYNYFNCVLAKNIKEKGIKLYLYTVNSSYDIKNFLDMNVDGIITNFPDKVSKLKMN